MKLRSIASAVAAVASVALVLPTAATAATSPGTDSHQADHRPHPGSIKLQDDFDHIGAEVHSLTEHGRTSYYIDEGSRHGRAVVFIGGQGTSLEAFQLTEFARTSRERLGLRVISVERNGFGESPLDLSLGYAEYNKEVVAVLNHLRIRRFVIMAISGGGAYAAQLAAAVPHRVISLHAAAAVSSTLPTRTPPGNCGLSLEERNAQNEHWTHNPKDWWAVSPDSPVLQVPAWQATAYLDAARSFFIAGQMGDPSALSHEGMLPCLPSAVVDPTRIEAPTFLYWGGADTSVPVSVMKQWQAAIPNVVEATVYPGEGHTVQYRHWDQILVDMAGYGDYTVVCRRGHTRLVPDAWAKGMVSRGATLGLCAWRRGR